MLYMVCWNGCINVSILNSMQWNLVLHSSLWLLSVEVSMNDVLWMIFIYFIFVIPNNKCQVVKYSTSVTRM